MLGTRQKDLESVNPWAYGFIVGKGYTRCYRYGVSVRDNMSMRSLSGREKPYLFQVVWMGSGKTNGVTAGVGRDRF
jgi:hypothetical protein